MDTSINFTSISCVLVDVWYNKFSSTAVRC